MSSSLKELYLARLREFYRQPARIFWVYGFPMVLAIGLGLAFKSPATPTVQVDLVRLTPPAVAWGPVGKLLGTTGESTVTPPDSPSRTVRGRDGRPDLVIRLVSETEGDRRVKTGKSPLLVIPEAADRVAYRFD